MRIGTPDDGKVGTNMGPIGHGVRPLHIKGTGITTVTQENEYDHDTLTVNADTTGFIRFNTEPQVGTYLEIETIGTDPTHVVGQYYNAGIHNIQMDGGSTTANGSNGGQILVSSTVQILGRAPTVSRSTPAEIDVGTGADSEIFMYAKTLAVNPLPGGGSAKFEFYDHHGDPFVQFWDAGGENAISWFGATPVAQEGAPSSPQDIADSLANYGLLSSAGTVVVDGGSP